MVSPADMSPVDMDPKLLGRRGLGHKSYVQLTLACAPFWARKFPQ